MRPYLSIIIPYYNSSDTIERLLLSIKGSKHAPSYEVIVVDDGSLPSLSFRPQSRNPDGSRVKPGMTVRTIRFDRNHGPAVARNRGVAKARGKFVVFLDSDVELFGDTLHNIATIYKDDPDIVALTGVWVKEKP